MAVTAESKTSREASLKDLKLEDKQRIANLIKELARSASESYFNILLSLWIKYFLSIWVIQTFTEVLRHYSLEVIYKVNL